MYGENTKHHSNPYIQGTTVPCDSACTHKFPQGTSHEWICITLSGIVLSLQNLELHIRDECSTFFSYFVSMVMTFDLIKHCFLIKILFFNDPSYNIS